MLNPMQQISYHLIAGVAKWSTQTRTHPPSRKDKAKATGGKEKILNRQSMDGWTITTYPIWKIIRREVSGKAVLQWRDFFDIKTRNRKTKRVFKSLSND